MLVLNMSKELAERLLSLRVLTAPYPHLPLVVLAEGVQYAWPLQKGVVL